MLDVKEDIHLVSKWVSFHTPQTNAMHSFGKDFGPTMQWQQDLDLWGCPKGKSGELLRLKHGSDPLPKTLQPHCEESEK